MATAPMKGKYARVVETDVGKCFLLVQWRAGVAAEELGFDIMLFHARSMRMFVGKGAIPGLKGAQRQALPVPTDRAGVSRVLCLLKPHETLGWCRHSDTTSAGFASSANRMAWAWSPGPHAHAGIKRPQSFICLEHWMSLAERALAQGLASAAAGVAFEFDVDTGQVSTTALVHRNRNVRMLALSCCYCVRQGA